MAFPSVRCCSYQAWETIRDLRGAQFSVFDVCFGRSSLSHTENGPNRWAFAADKQLKQRRTAFPGIVGHTSAPARNSYQALQSFPPQKIKLNARTLEFSAGLWWCKPAVLCVRAHVRITAVHTGLSGYGCTHQEKKYYWKGQSELYLPRQEKAQLARWNRGPALIQNN